MNMRNKHVANKTAAVEKFAGSINPQTIITGNIIVRKSAVTGDQMKVGSTTNEVRGI